MGSFWPDSQQRALTVVGLVPSYSTFTWAINNSTDSTGPQTAGGVGFKGFLEAAATGVPYTFWIDSLLGESL